MKIVDIEVIELRVPGWTGDTFDGSYDNCLVLVHTDEGVSGISEVDSVPSVIRAIVDAPRSHTHAMGLKEVLVGSDPSDVEGLWDRMYDLTSYYGRRGAVIHAISAVDIALWDLRGKVLDKSRLRLAWATPARPRARLRYRLSPGRDAGRSAKKHRPRPEARAQGDQDRRRSVLAR